MTIQRRIAEGEILPWGYGLSYRDWPTYYAVCYPFPLNHLVRWIRDAWFFIRDTPREQCAYCQASEVRRIKAEKMLEYSISLLSHTEELQRD